MRQLGLHSNCKTQLGPYSTGASTVKLGHTYPSLVSCIGWAVGGKVISQMMSRVGIRADSQPHFRLFTSRKLKRMTESGSHWVVSVAD